MPPQTFFKRNKQYVIFMLPVSTYMIVFITVRITVDDKRTKAHGKLICKENVFPTTLKMSFSFVLSVLKARLILNYFLVLY